MAETTRTARDAVDHLLLGAPDRDQAIAWFERLTGVRPLAGGSHPGMGTRNALVSLGPGRYVEIIAPDPAQSALNFHIDLRSLSAPRPVAWAGAAEVDAVSARARVAGLEVFGPRDGARARPDGTMLHWRTVGISTDLSDRLVDAVPFFIQWSSGTPHPSSDSPQGCTLVSLEFRHPKPDRLKHVLATLGIDAVVSSAPDPALVVVIDTPRGKVTL